MRFGILTALLLTCAVEGHAQEPKTVLVEGRFGTALDASKGGFIAPANAKFGGFPITAELWFQAPSFKQSHTLLANEMRTSGTSWRLTTESGTGRLAIELPGFRPSRVVAAAAQNRVGDWRYAAVVLEKNRVRVYDNGQLVINQAVTPIGLPSQSSGFGVGVAVDDRRPAKVRIDDVRVSTGAREIAGMPGGPFVEDEATLALWTFDESKEEYLSKWTPGGLTNQAGLPYPHREAAFEFEKDPDWADARWQETNKGRFVTHSTLLPKRGVSAKNMTIFPGDQNDFALMFDLQRCAVMAVVDNATFKIDEFRFGLLRKPTLEGNLRTYVNPTKLWRDYGQNRKPIPFQASDYKQLTTNPGKAPTLNYTIMGAGFAETYRVTDRPGKPPVLHRFIRTRNVSTRLELTLAEGVQQGVVNTTQLGQVATGKAGDRSIGFSLPKGTRGAELGVIGTDVVLRFAPAVSHEIALSYFVDEPAVATSDAFREARNSDREWGEPLITEGQVADSTGDDPWVIDTISVPFDNPHKALFYITALAFFPDGRAAVSTAHGDVWIVSGLDDSLQRVSWQRFATGLYQPLGLEIADGKVIVLGRDQLTRLHDTNGNGEADVYESFNNDLVIDGTDHAYAMRLERDNAGNFFFLKSGQKPHGRSLLRVTANGSQLDVIATGFRHPYGMGLSPRGEVTVADNEGPWVPSSKIDLIRSGGFYGFLGNEKEPPPGMKPEAPLCWIPKVADNSSGGQMWNTSDTWGPYHRDGMLHLSWGRCTMHAVLRDVVNGVHQGATVRFPGLTFESGSGEAEFNPKDGQLYVVGLDGWQTGAIKDGCFQRVRYTGKPVFMPSSFRVFANGIEIGFSEPLDRKQLADVNNYRIEQWNYRWTSTYGSFHYSVKNPEKIGHDEVGVMSVLVSPDQKRVFLKTNPLRSVDQIQVHIDSATRTGRPLAFDVYGTIKQTFPAR